MTDKNESPIDIEHHLMSFVDAFVIGIKKDRWKELLTRRGRNAHRDSHKLEVALDLRFCNRISETDDSMAETLGVYYDFKNELIMITKKEAIKRCSYLSGYRDAIFSIIPGQLAYYFYHEGWTWRCER